MPNTTISTRGESFLINDRLVYSEIEHSNPNAHGLLMNARFIQGIFDDRSNRARYARWGRDSFDPDEHTDNLIAALPEWRAHGLRAFTVGIQGGGPCFTIANRSAIDNNPFGEDGASFDDAYARRLDKLIRASDALGIVVIVSYFYVSQSPKLRNGKAVRNAVTVASNWLRDGGYANVMIEVANEYNIQGFNHPIIHEPEGMSALIDLARDESGGMLVGCSGGGGHLNREVAEASDIILIHGNGCSRQRFHNMIGEARGWGFNRPIICNEDSQALGNLGVAARNFASWGYYKNMTKREPPADWGITQGEDTYFARRMAAAVGIQLDPLPLSEQFYLQGLEPGWEDVGRRWIRLASEYPETIDRVDFYRNGALYDSAYDESFSLHFRSNWMQGPVRVQPDDKEWKAVIHLSDGQIIEKTARL